MNIRGRKKVKPTGSTEEKVKNKGIKQMAYFKPEKQRCKSRNREKSLQNGNSSNIR